MCIDASSVTNSRVEEGGTLGIGFGGGAGRGGAGGRERRGGGRREGKWETRCARASGCRAETVIGGWKRGGGGGLQSNPPDLSPDSLFCWARKKHRKPSPLGDSHMLQQRRSSDVNHIRILRGSRSRTCTPTRALGAPAGPEGPRLESVPRSWWRAHSGCEEFLPIGSRPNVYTKLD